VIGRRVRLIATRAPVAAVVQLTGSSLSELVRKALMTGLMER
jgi:hypothetical protein